MGLHRADAQVELVGDLVVGVAERDQAQHVELALGQVAGRAARSRGRGGHARAELGVEPGAAAGGSHRLDQLGAGRLLEHVAAGARAQGLARERRVLLHGQDHHRGIGRGLGHGRDRLQARAARHVEVEHEHGWLVAEHGPTRRVDIARLGKDLDVILGLEQHAQAAADHRVVVR